ncbi:MAG: hypothetical protein AB1439_04430 [candidate division FCPU426 bacterium]
MSEPSGKKNQQEPGEDKHFFVKMPEAPQIGSAEALRHEQQLLAALKTKGPRAETLEPLVVFYSRVGQQERAYHYIKLWMKHARSQDELADCLLLSGQLAEQVNQPEAAIAFYREGLAHKTENVAISYYLRNNLAYCLNLRGEYLQALDLTQQAITLDPSRPNAFKNLGVSLQGLGRYAEAARAFLKAIHVDVAYPRSLPLLEQLLAGQREKVLAEIPDIDEQVEACRRASQTVQSGRFADWAKGLTLN